MKQKTIIEDFAYFCSNLRFEDIPQPVIEKVKLQIINTITAAEFSDWHKEAFKTYNTLNIKEKDIPIDKKKSTVLPLNKKLTAESAATINSAYAMSLDYDDYMLVSHMGYSSVLTSLAFLEENGGTIKDLIKIATAVNEITGRLCLSCFFGPLNGQMLTYIHNLGAAAAVGMVKGFNFKKLAHTLSLSLYQPNFCLVPGFYTDGCKLLTASYPIQIGIQAALYAEQGLEGPLSIIEGPMGFFHFFSFHTIPEFVQDLGNSWLSYSLSYKRYPGTSYIAASVDSSLDAIKRLGLTKISEEDVDKIKEINIHTTIMSSTIESLSRMQTTKGDDHLDPILINFSVRKSVAYALVHGDLLPKHFKQEEIDKYKELVLKIIKKIKVHQDIGMTLDQFMTFPNVEYIIARMSKKERKQVFSHLTAANPKKDSIKNRLKNVKVILSSEAGKAIIKAFIKKKIFRIKKKIDIRDVDLPNYMMLQAAKSKITLNNGESAESSFPIPRGGCGLPFEELENWVKKRYNLSFNKDPELIFKMLSNSETKISDFVMELMK